MVLYAEEAHQFLLQCLNDTAFGLVLERLKHDANLFITGVIVIRHKFKLLCLPVQKLRTGPH